MAMNLKSPGVFVQEISTLPVSVAQVETAIPAFIGFTEKFPGTIRPIKIRSLLEYELLFGKAKPEKIKVTIENGELLKPELTNPSGFNMYYALQMFYANGGGACYIVSVSDYSGKGNLSDGLAQLETADEPTLIVFPDACRIDKAADYYTLYASALSQANKLQDRFVIIDTYVDDNKKEPKGLRDAIGMKNLKYGAAYFPYLETTLNYSYEDADVSVNGLNLLDSNIVTLESIKDTNTVFYNEIKKELARLRVILPPSSAIAGIYASVDRDRGVWKAPANISINAVIGPTQKITNDLQDGLNVDPESGKSINAIRMFSGKGTLVWGARTLSGNDNEWRYVSVRRFFNMVEESVKKATSWAVFEANNANTWVRIRGTIENYLTNLWRQGALAGSKPKQAFFVNVGLGVTMTSQDILEGIMNIEIGLAVSKPAEFIILKFSHKLQEA